MEQVLTLPGLIDCHVHFREPGLERKGDMKSESTAARAGGVLTVCDMPNTMPPTQTVFSFKEKASRAARIKEVDIRLFFGATEPEHLDELKELWTTDAYADLKASCCGLKLYLEHSTGNQKANAAVIDEAFRVCAELGITLVAHCEDPAMNEAAALEFIGDDIQLHSKKRPAESEAKSVQDAIALVRKYGTKFHVAHLSTSGGADAVRMAKEEGLPVTCEVAPHHLFLTTDDYETLGTLAKMNPPLRDPEHQRALWEAIADGTVDCVATDHAPHLLHEKQAGQPLEAPSGVPGVETMLPLLLTVAAGGWPHPTSERPDIQFSHDDIVRLCFENPNRIFKLNAPATPRVHVDTSKEWTIDAVILHSKCGWTPYDGWNVRGAVTSID